MRNLTGIFFIIVLFQSVNFRGQPGLYRQFTHTPASQFGTWWINNPQMPASTADGGYLFSHWQFVWGLHSPVGLGEGYTIKTDSNFVPQWKKSYARAVPLPTGGVILIHNNSIEKVTASGVQVWVKHLTVPVTLNDAVIYGNKIRFVGTHLSFTMPLGLILYCYTTDGFTMLMDTSGNYISQTLFQSSLMNTLNFTNFSYRASSEFSRIERDAQGNFFVYSNPRTMSGINSNMSIAKFDTSFSFVWAKTWSSASQATFFNDIDILPNGRIFVSAVTPGNTGSQWNQRTALLKLDPQGNVLSQCFFENRLASTAFTRKTSGNYIMSLATNDSLFMLETDTSFNVSWFRFQGKNSAVGGSVLKNNSIYTLRSALDDLVLTSADLSGNSCSSYSMSFTKPTSSVTLVNFTLSPASFSASIVSGTINDITSQSYVDSCKCPVFVPLMQNNVCVGNTASVAILGTGPLSWYGSATGSDFIQSGSQFIYSSATPTSFVVFAQDSACVANPHRTAVNIVVNAVPSLSFSPANPLICPGHQVFVTALGATNYTWSHSLPLSHVQNLNPSVTTVYTVTGSVAPGCNDTKTVAVSVVPAPTITVTSPSTLCAGTGATLAASGGTSYSWWNGQSGPTITITPLFSGTHNFNVAGSNGACNGFATASINVIATPTVTVTSNPPLLCLGQSVTLTAGGASSYSWSTGATGPGLVSAPQSTTLYVVNGFNMGCQSSATLNVPVQALPQISVAATPTIACEGSPVVFSASGAATYSWSNGPTAATFSVAAPSGVLILTVTASDGICSATGQTSISGIQVPTVAVSITPSVICAGQAATVSATGAGTYSWAHGSAMASFTTYGSIGSNTYQVAGANSICSSSAHAVLVVLPSPTLTVSGQSVLCLGDSAVFSASGANTYSWNSGSLSSTLGVSPHANTIYIVQGTSNGCTSSASVAVAVQSLPSITVTPLSNTYCIGVPLTFTASGGTTYTWNSGVTGATHAVSVQPGVNSYSLIASDGTCHASASRQVTGVYPPVLSVSHPSLLCEGSTTTITASGAGTYSWSNGATTNSIVITVMPNLMLTVYGNYGLCESSQSIPLSISPSPVISIVQHDSLVCAGEQVTIQAYGATSYSWNTGDTTSLLVEWPSVTTNYVVQGSNHFGCTTTASFLQVVDPCLGFATVARNLPGISVFPNPHNHHFDIIYDEVWEGRIGLLLNSEGRVVHCFTLSGSNTTINTGQLAKGIYLLRIGQDYAQKVIRN